MWQNSRCSIWFHLLVPGGKWHTLILSPSSSASCCTHTFHSRDRLPLLPPASAVTSNSSACGYTFRPIRYHQRRTDSTANSAVSCVMPTLTHPSLAVTSYTP